MMKAGPLFDMTKPPRTEFGEVPKEESDALSGANAHMTERNPVEYYLDNVSNLRSHLESNFEYAKRIEVAIDS